MRVKVNKNTFTGHNFYVGIDVHKKSWTVTILNEQYEHKTMTQPPEARHLSNYLNQHFPGGYYYAVYEAGFSGFGACRELRSQGVDCMVINAADVPTSVKEKLQKTDVADSRKLARSLRAGELSAIDIPDPRLEADRALIRQRFGCVKDIGRTKHKIKSLLMQFGIEIPEDFTVGQTRKLTKKYMVWIRSVEIAEPTVRQVLDNYLDDAVRHKEQLLKLNRQLRALADTEPYRANMVLLRSMPGIGFFTSIYFLVQVGDIVRFKSIDKLNNYVGLVPTMHQSGEKTTTGHLIKRGRKEIKVMLIEASWDAIRLDGALMAYFNELAKRMNKNKAIIRIARKLLSRMRYVLVNQTPYVTGVLQ